MADPKQIADALAQDQLLAQFNRGEGQAQPWYMKPMDMEGRATFLPFKDTLPGSVMNQRELALPGLLAGAVNAFTAPSRVSTQGFDAPEEAQNLAMNVMGGGITTGKMMQNPTGVGGTDLALNVYHGTPHEIKGGFDLAKVGTGEGAQSYGHGIYFGEARGTGEQYRDTLGFVGAKDKAGEVYGKDGISFFFENALEKSGIPQSAAKSQAQLWADKFVKGETINNPIANQVIESKGLQPNKIGNLYKADIPDAAIPMMLDWDNSINKTLVKPIRKLLMSDKIEQRALDDFGVTTKKELADLLLKDNPTGQQLYDNLIYVFRTDKAASGALAEFGIPGMKYLDEGSRAAGKGTSNFVSYQPETIKILEKNDVPISRKELLKQEFDKLDK